MSGDARTLLEKFLDSRKGSGAGGSLHPKTPPPPPSTVKRGQSLGPPSGHDQRARREGIAGILLGAAALVTAVGSVFRPQADQEEQKDLVKRVEKLERALQRHDTGRQRIYLYEIQFRNYVVGVLQELGVKVHEKPDGPALEPVEILPAPANTLGRAPQVQPSPPIPAPPNPDQDGDI